MLAEIILRQLKLFFGMRRMLAERGSRIWTPRRVIGKMDNMEDFSLLFGTIMSALPDPLAKVEAVKAAIVNFFSPEPPLIRRISYGRA